MFRTKADKSCRRQIESQYAPFLVWNDKPNIAPVRNYLLANIDLAGLLATAAESCKTCAYLAAGVCTNLTILKRLDGFIFGWCPGSAHTRHAHAGCLHFFAIGVGIYRENN
jgi:hypothetical protein